MLAKRLSMSILAVGMISLIVSGATYALFTASTENKDNTFTAGTVDLEDSFTVTCAVEAGGLAPGDSGACSGTIDYKGSLEAWIGLKFAADATTDLFKGANPVQLSAPAGLKLIGGRYVIMKAAAGNVTPVEVPVSVTYSFPIAAGNEYQGKSGKFTVTVDAVQARNNTNAAKDGPIYWNEDLTN